MRTLWKNLFNVINDMSNKGKLFRGLSLIVLGLADVAFSIAALVFNLDSTMSMKLLSLGVAIAIVVFGVWILTLIKRKPAVERSDWAGMDESFFN